MVKAFGATGRFASICSGDWSLSFASIADAIIR